MVRRFGLVVVHSAPHFLQSRAVDPFFFLDFLVALLRQASSSFHQGIRPAAECGGLGNLLERALTEISSTSRYTASSIEAGVGVTSGRDECCRLTMADLSKD